MAKVKSTSATKTAEETARPFARLMAHVKSGFAGINPNFDNLLAEAEAEHAAHVAVAEVLKRISCHTIMDAKLQHEALSNLAAVSGQK